MSRKLRPGPLHSEQFERVPTKIHERSDDAALHLHHRTAVPPAVLVCEGGDVLDPARVGALVCGVDAEFPAGADGEREHTGVGHQLRKCGGRGGQCGRCGAGAGAGEEGGEDEGEGEGGRGGGKEGAVKNLDRGIYINHDCSWDDTIDCHPSASALHSEPDVMFVQACSPVYLQFRTLYHRPYNNNRPLAES